MGWLRALDVGDLVRHRDSGSAYVVVLPASGNRPPVVALHVTAGNPDEWVRVGRSGG